MLGSQASLILHYKVQGVFQNIEPKGQLDTGLYFLKVSKYKRVYLKSFAKITFIFFSFLHNIRNPANKWVLVKVLKPLKGVFAKNERGYKKRFWSLLILLLSVASIRRKLLKTTNTEERSVLTNSEKFIFQRIRK